MVRSFLASFFLLTLVLPGTAQMWHAFYGHVEIHCQADIPNHFHQAEFNCDFHTFFASPSALPAPLTLEVFRESVREATLPAYRCPAEERPWVLMRLRGPPHGVQTS